MKKIGLVFLMIFAGLVLASIALAEGRAKFPIYLAIKSVDFYESIKFETLEGRPINTVSDQGAYAVVCANRRNDEFSSEISRAFLENFLEGLRRNGVEGTTLSEGLKAPSSITIRMAYEIPNQTFAVYMSLTESAHLVTASTTTILSTISGGKVGTPMIVAKSLAKALAKDLADKLAKHLKMKFEIRA